MKVPVRRSLSMMNAFPGSQAPHRRGFAYETMVERAEASLPKGRSPDWYTQDVVAEVIMSYATIHSLDRIGKLVRHPKGSLRHCGFASKYQPWYGRDLAGFVPLTRFMTRCERSA